MKEHKFGSVEKNPSVMLFYSQHNPSYGEPFFSWQGLEGDLLRKTVSQLVLAVLLLQVVLMLQAPYSKLVETSGPIKTKSILGTLTDESLHGGKLWR